MADVGIEAFPENNQHVEATDAVTADARSLPFADNSLQTVIGRRFLHHVPATDQQTLLAEADRVLTDDGTLVLVERTLGLYRRLTKGIVFKIGVLGEDNDEYGHLAAEELHDIVRQAGFDVIDSRPLGSPLMPLYVLESVWTRRLITLYEGRNSSAGGHSSLRDQ